MSHLISVNGVSKQYSPDNVSLKPVSFVIGQGERFCIQGSSGKGKTTLLNIIALIEQFTTGQYHLDGHDIAQCIPSEIFHLRKTYFSYVFQSLCLIPQLCVMENLMLPSLYRGINRHDAKKACQRLLAHFQLEALATKRAGHLSGGEKQRISIIRAISTQPKILLADEPTGSLDVENGHYVQSLLAQVNEEQGISLVLVTHDPQLAKMCPRRISLS